MSISLEEAIDIHVHTAPDLIEREASDLTVAQAAITAGMDGVVVKSHVIPTVARVDQVNEAVSEEILYGGIALNGGVGGLNPDAVEIALELGAKIVWLPTAWSANHAQQAREAGQSRFVGQRIPEPDEEISVARNGELIEPMQEIIELVASYDATLATGHITPMEIKAVVVACADAGVRVLVNHPFFHIVDLSLDKQLELVEMGAVMEYCAYAVQSTEGHTLEQVVDAIEQLGVESCILATDFGQRGNPAIEGFRSFACEVHEAGIPEEDIQTLITENPARVLGLSS